jgi:Skp family chaperone for outer membrane proteins
LQQFVTLKHLHASIVKELQDRLDLEKASHAEKEKALAKKLKALEAELQETRSKASEELKATIDEAKLWAAKSVVAARLKMAKEAAEPGFDKAS